MQSLLTLLLVSTLYVYQSERESEVTKTSWTVEETPQKVRVTGDGMTSKTILDFDHDFYLLDYCSLSKNSKNQVRMTLDGTTVQYEKRVGDEKESGTLNLKRNPWVQQLYFGLRPFALSSEEKFFFSIIQESDFSIHDMVAKKDGVQTLEMPDGKKVEALKINLTLTGFKSLFWSAEIWFDPKTGDCLLYKGNEGPNTPTTTVSLLSKKKS